MSFITDATSGRDPFTLPDPDQHVQDLLAQLEGARAIAPEWWINFEDMELYSASPEQLLELMQTAPTAPTRFFLLGQHSVLTAIKAAEKAAAEKEAAEKEAAEKEAAEKEAAEKEAALKMAAGEGEAAQDDGEVAL